MHPNLAKILDDLALYGELDAPRRAEFASQARHIELKSSAEVTAFVEALEAAWPQPAGEGPPPHDALGGLLFERLAQACASPRCRGTISRESFTAIERLHRRMGPQSRSRYHLLRALSAQNDRAALKSFAELVVTDLPTDAKESLLAFVPLFQRRDYEPACLFPRLLEGLENPLLAAVVLDLANYVTREKLAPRHPAADRVDPLAALLGSLVLRLQRLEESPQEVTNSPRKLADLVGEAVSLVVTLCDALALIGDPKVAGKLHQALELAHRRVRTEAAVALARLGDEAGIDTLVTMAAEPTVRTRALAYLEELDKIEKIPENDRSAVARAEGMLAAWLAEPTQFGMPPSSLELVDARRQFWPSYEEPIDCYLFRYEFRAGGKGLSGVGIVGPATYAMVADLQDLSPDDIYAVYAGWQAEHESISETPAERLSAVEQASWEQNRAGLTDAGFEDVHLVKLGHFFGDEHWVAQAKREDCPGVLVLDSGEVSWHPIVAGRRSPGPQEVYYLHKGRALLRTFNREQ